MIPALRTIRNPGCTNRNTHGILSRILKLGLVPVFALMFQAPALANSSEDFATGTTKVGASPRNFELEFNGTFFTPRIDEESGMSGTPYKDVFDDKRLWLFETEFDWEIVDLQGPLGIGAGIGFGRVSGRGRYADNGEEALEKTSLILVPARIMAVYRFQWLDRQGIPLIPFVKAGLGYTFWWTKGDSGAVSSESGRKGRGGKWGYNLAVGLSLSLNFIDRPLARDGDRLWGLNDTHLIVQFVHATADNFGGDGFDLSRDSLHVGLGFEF